MFASRVAVCSAESLVATVGFLPPGDAMTHLLPIILRFLRGDDVPEVRLKVLESLHNVAAVVGERALEGELLPALEQLAGDQQWRVRLKVVEQMPMLAERLGPDVFEARLLNLFLGMLQDEVHAVRVAASSQLATLAEHMGASWCDTRLRPKLEALYNSGRSYLQRITVLYAVRSLANREELGPMLSMLIPILVDATQDRVPNVRFVAAQVLEVVGKVVDSEVIDRELRPALDRLVGDADGDVRHFAQVAARNVSPA